MSVIQLTFPFAHTEDDVRRAVEQRFGAGAPFRILKRSIDARHHRSIRVEYSVTPDCSDPVDAIRTAVAQRCDMLLRRVGDAPLPTAVVVGAGPGGLFSALWLSMHGLRPILLEQGPPMAQRLRDMAAFMKRGEFHPHSNICFGAGGAGAYSDGKLITRIKSPFISFVMAVFTEAGGDPSIRYVYNPHLGSNRIRRCIVTLLDTLRKRGVDIRHDTRFLRFTEARDGSAVVHTSAGDITDVRCLVMATGHSARDTYASLRAQEVAMEAKDFAVGVRVEHPSHFINAVRYGSGYEDRYPGIETAQYRFAKSWKEQNRAVYSFCMCPGGHVINAGTSTDGVVTNGMSNALKAGRFSNAAFVVNVTQEDLARLGHDGIEAGIAFQRDLEEQCRAAVNAPGSCHILPAQRLTDFMEVRPSASVGEHSCMSPAATAPIHTLFPRIIASALRRGLADADRTMPGFATHPQALIFAPETRTSSPLRILRDAESCSSPDRPFLFPCGEGAGYAGGITSAAVDGIRCAERFIDTLV